MSKTIDLLTVDYHSDDDTGMYRVGEVDFGIHGSLDDFLKSYGDAGRKEILFTLCFLISTVNEKWERIQRDSRDYEQAGKVENPHAPKAA